VSDISWSKKSRVFGCHEKEKRSTKHIGRERDMKSVGHVREQIAQKRVKGGGATWQRTVWHTQRTVYFLQRKGPKEKKKNQSLAQKGVQSPKGRIRGRDSCFGVGGKKAAGREWRAACSKGSRSDSWEERGQFPAFNNA